MQLGQRCCQNPEQLKAWSQNLGHESVLTTLYSYGTVAPARQAEIIKTLGRPDAAPNPTDLDIAMKLMLAMRQAGMPMR